MKRRYYFYISLVVFFVIIGYFGFYENLTMQREVQLADNLNEQLIIEKRVMAELDKMNAITEILSKIEEVQTLNHREISNLFSRLSHANTGMANILVFDRQGNVVGTMAGRPGQLYIADKQGIQAALSGKTVLSNKFYAPSLKTWLVAIKTPIRTEDGRIVGGLSTAITVNKLQEALQGVRLKNNAIPILVDKDGNVIYYPGLPKAKQELFRENIFKQFQLTASGSIRSQSPTNKNDTMYTYQRLGDTGWYLALAQPMAILNINLIIEAFINLMIIGMGCIILFLLNKQSRLQEVKDKLERDARMDKLEAVGQLAAGIAHEIRNPLTTVKGFLQMLQTNPEKLKNEHYLEVMLEEIDHINEITGEFLSLAKPSAPKISVFDLNELLNNLFYIMNSQAVMNNVELKLQLVENLPRLAADVAQIKQVIINLVKNAVEACGESGGCVVVSTNSSGSMIQLNVLDNGQGMPREVLEKLGTPFFTTKLTGSGLGIMVCLSIVQNMGGSIKMESSPNQGTEIVVNLPVADYLEDKERY